MDSQESESEVVRVDDALLGMVMGVVAVMTRSPPLGLIGYRANVFGHQNHLVEALKGGAQNLAHHIARRIGVGRGPAALVILQ